MADRPLHFKTTLDDSQFQAALKRNENQIKGFADNTVNETQRIDAAFSTLAKSITAFFSVQAAANFITSMVQVRGEFQQLEVAFNTMLGSKAKADRLMAESVKLAAITPFGLQDVASGAKQLLAYGEASETIIDTLTMLGDVSAGVGSQLGDVVYLYGTLMASGRVTQMDINQFAGRGIPIYEELARAMGIAVDQVRDYVSAGKVGFSDVQKAFTNMTSAGGKFFNLMEEQSKTLTGQIANMQDAWDVMLNEMGESSEGIVSKSIAGLTYLIENYDKVIRIIGNLIAVYGTYRAALIVNNTLINLQTAGLGRWTAAELLHFNALRLKEAALARLNVLMAASPVLALTALISALAAVTYSLAQHTSGAAQAQKNLSDIQDEGGVAAQKETQRIGALVKIVQDHTKTNKERKKAYDELKQSTDDAIEGFTQEAVAAGDATIALNEYIESVRKTYEEAAAFKKYNELQEQLAEITVEGYKAIGMWDKLAQSIKNTFAPSSQDLSMSDWWKSLWDSDFSQQTIVDQSKQAIQTQIDSLRNNYGDSIDSLLTGSDDTENEEKKKQEKLSKELLAERKKFLTQLNKAEHEAMLSRLSDNEREIAENKAKYEKMREDAKKAGLGGAVITRIDRMEVQTTGTIAYDQDTERFIDNLNKKREAYERYEDAKLTISKEKAGELYGYDLEEFDTFLEYIISEEDKLREKSTTANLSRGEMDRLKKIVAIRESEEDKIREKRAENLAYVYQKTLSYEQKIAQLREKYAKEEADIRKEYSGQELEARLKVNSENAAKEFNNLFSDILKEQRKFEDVSDMVAGATKNQIRAQIQSLQTYLRTATDLTAEQRDKLEAMIKSLQLVLPSATNDGTGREQLSPGATRLQDLDNEAISAKNKIKELEASLLTLRSATTGSIPKEAITKAQQLQAEIDGIKARLSDIPLERMEALGELFTDLGSGIDGLISDFDGFNDALSNTLGILSDITKIGGQGISGISSILKGIEGIKNLGSGEGGLLGGLKGLFSKDAENGGGLLGGLSSIASLAGPIGKGVALVGKAIGGIVNHFKKIKESEIAARKAMDDFYKEATRGEMEYQALLRKREIDTAKAGKTSYQALIAELELIKRQTPEIQKAYDKVFQTIQGGTYVSGIGYRHSTWFREAKTWDIMSSLAGSDYARLEQLYTQGKLSDQAKEDFEALRNLREELEAAGLDVEELQGQINEMMTGTSVEGLSDALADLFASGKNAAADFGKSFEDILRTAIINGFKYRYIEQAIEPLFNQLVEFGKDGYTQAELNNLMSLGQNIFSGLNEAWKPIQDLFNEMGWDDISMDSPSRDTINRITETQADAITGTLKGIQITGIENNRIIKAQTEAIVQNQRQQIISFTQAIDHLVAIKNNTGQTAENTNRLEAMERSLKNIDSKMSNPENVKRASGY